MKKDYHVPWEEWFSRRVDGGILGAAVGDAMGVPVECVSRETLDHDPVTDMRSGGTHGQPAGTWSDDTSMTLCTMDSLIEKGLDYDDQMCRFEDWLWSASNTAHDEVFDVGGTTKAAIFKHVKGTPALECGELADNTCGNGSLMRMLPTALYIVGKYRNYSLDDRAAEIVHQSSMCTHAHKICQMACGIFTNVVFQMFRCSMLTDVVRLGISSALSFYKGCPDFAEVYDEFASLNGIGTWTREQIRSSGYVVHTLQAALWCLLTTGGYAECVLKAVNLGEDTDTTAAVAGGLAGMWYYARAIPTNWIEALAKGDEIRAKSRRFTYACLDKN